MTRPSITSPSSTDHWRARTPLNLARSHCAVAVVDSQIYVFGGGGPNFQSLNSSVVYDPARDEWRDLAPMPTFRSGTVTAVVNGKIYVMAGGYKQPDGTFRFLNTVEIYDPERDQWQAGPSLIQPHDYPAIAELDGRIYVMGGHHPEAYLGGPKTDPGFDFCERFDPATGKWQAIAPLSQPRFALAAVTMDRRLLAMGGVAFTPHGFNNFTLIEEYDARHDRWLVRDDLALPWPAAGLSAAMVGGCFCIFGGYSGDGIHPRAARYEPRTAQWVLLPPMPAPRAAAGIAVIGETVYLIGGWADDGRTPQATVFSYDILAKSGNGA